MQTTIAVLENEYLVALGLKNCLNMFYPSAEVIVYNSFDDCRHDIERSDGRRPYFVHFFVSDSILALHRNYFLSLPQMTIALVRRTTPFAAMADFPTLDVTANQQHLLQNLLNLHKALEKEPSNGVTLSKREVQVLQCVAKGMLNKEIADALCISQNTVITHRAHITEKLGVHSVAVLTVYAVLNGYVSYSEIYDS